MTRSIQTLLIITLAVTFGSAFPPPATADDMVLFRNGRTLRADELELKDGIYRITTMAGGVMEVPVHLVERVISCVVDKDVEEQRGTVPAGTQPPVVTRGGGRSSVTRIPPAGSPGDDASMGKSPLGGAGRPGGGRAGGGAIAIPPRGGRSLGKAGGGAKSIPAKGTDEKGADEKKQVP